MLLDVPYALAAAPAMSEQGYPAGICLGIVGTDKAEQSGFPGTVGPHKSPSFSPADDPVKVFEYGPFPVAYADFLQPYHLGGRISLS